MEKDQGGGQDPHKVVVPGKEEEEGGRYKANQVIYTTQ
jgi:hypothetical protein